MKKAVASISLPRVLFAAIHNITGDAFWVNGFWVNNFWIDDLWVDS